MKLSELVDKEDILDIKGSIDIDIKEIAYDSRKVSAGSLFVAIEGFKVDGHTFIGDVIEKGVKTLIVEKDIEVDGDVTVIKVKNSRQALAKASSRFFDNPSEKFHLIGITGTNAKTTITYLIKSIFEATNKKVGIVGTIGNIIDKKLYETNNTTPESLELQKTFNQMVESEIDSCIMEVSSHALELSRVDCSNFEVGLFTNLSVDHLDFHKNLDSYFEAKLKLFYMTNKYNIVNADDEYGIKIIEKIGKKETKLLTYGIVNKSDIYATDIEYHLYGVDFKLNTPKGDVNVSMNIPGEFSVYNSLAAASSALSYDIDLYDIKKGLESVKGVKGRFEVVSKSDDFVTIIDFAHTPDALEKVLKSIRGFANGRIVVVFGAGGDRDNSKRAPMGEVVGRNADFSVVTSDNPRNENPISIIEDILIGTKKVTDKYIAIVDRKEAIEYAIKNSEKNDIILLAGKGHETYTIVGDRKVHFDEREIVKEVIKKLNKRA